MPAVRVNVCVFFRTPNWLFIHAVRVTWLILHGWSLVVDTRYAAGTNDPRFEQDLIDWIGRASQHFVRFAVLVKTQAGVNQAARHTAKAANGLATLDEAMAHAWARGPRA